jgi:hypothetical protein
MAELFMLIGIVTMIIVGVCVLLMVGASLLELLCDAIVVFAPSLITILLILSVFYLILVFLNP